MSPFTDAPSVSAVDDGTQGIFICVGGLGMLVASDEITDKDWPALSRAKGDVLMLVGASLYGFSECAAAPRARCGPRTDVMRRAQRTRPRSSSSGGRRCTRSSASSGCGASSSTASRPRASSTKR